MSVYIFLDGNVASVQKKELIDFAPGIIHAPGAFETMLVLDGKIMFWDRHIRRFKKGLKFFHMRLPASEKKIHDLSQKILKKNKLSNARIRIAVWKDQNKNHFSIIAQPIQKRSAKEYQKGFSVGSSTLQRNRTSYSHLKTMYYRTFYKAYQEAIDQGYDEAVLLNANRDVVESARANIFCLRKNKLMTPSVDLGCLNGITRQVVLSIACAQELEVCIGRFSSRSFKQADEVFLTNSILGVMPVTQWDGHLIGQGCEGVRTFQIRQSYKQALAAL